MKEVTPFLHILTTNFSSKLDPPPEILLVRGFRIQ